MLLWMPPLNRCSCKVGISSARPPDHLFACPSAKGKLHGSATQFTMFCGPQVADACTRVPSATGLAASSVQWGAWGSIGMVADNAAVHRAMQRSGVGMLQPWQGLAAMQQLLAGAAGPAAAAAAQLAAIPFVWPRFMQQQRHAVAFLYGEHLPAQQNGLPLLPPAAVPAHQQQPFSTASGAASTAAAPAIPSQEEVLQQVLSVVTAVHGSAVDPQQPLVQAGLDSLGEPLPPGLAVVPFT